MHNSKKTKHSLFLRGGGFPAFWYMLGYGYELYFNNHKYERTHLNKTNKHFTNFQKRLTKDYKVGGFSAGALAAVLLVCYKDNPNYKNYPLNLVIKSCMDEVPLCKYGSISKAVENMMNNSLPDNAHEIANKHNLELIMCDAKNNYATKLVNHWDSKEDLVQCLVASSHIPFVSGGFYPSKNNTCIDGMFCKDLNETIRANYDHVVMHKYPPIYVENMSIIDKKAALKKFDQGRIEAMKSILHLNDDKSNLNADKRGPPENRTQIAGFKVPSDNHYTSRPGTSEN